MCSEHVTRANLALRSGALEARSCYFHMASITESCNFMLVPRALWMASLFWIEMSTIFPMSSISISTIHEWSQVSSIVACPCLPRASAVAAWKCGITVADGCGAGAQPSWALIVADGCALWIASITLSTLETRAKQVEQHCNIFMRMHGHGRVHVHVHGAAQVLKCQTIQVLLHI